MTEIVKTNLIELIANLYCGACDNTVKVPVTLILEVDHVPGEHYVSPIVRKDSVPPEWKEYDDIVKELGYKYGSDFHMYHSGSGLICEDCQTYLRNEHSSGKWYKNGKVRRERKYV